jgi:hypothetical protein
LAQVDLNVRVPTETRPHLLLQNPDLAAISAVTATSEATAAP